MSHESTISAGEPGTRFRIRRGRRTDFMAVMHLLAADGEPVPVPDRATLRRFRHLVADLGADFYLVSVDGRLAGLVHLTYARQLAGAPRAQLDQLVVAQSFRRRGIGSALLAFAQGRAQRRGCATLSCTMETRGASHFLERAGLRATGTSFEQDLQAGARE